jgi:hypothetical protein
VFTGIYETNEWGSNASRSGPGSDDLQTRVVISELPKVLGLLGVRSILDCPCGDFLWMSRVELPNVHYIGGDIVQELVDQNIARFGTDRREFVRLNLITDRLPRTDAVLVRDCLVHLPNSMVRDALENIRSSGITWLIATTFPTRTANPDIPIGMWRPINLEAAPFILGTPLHLIVEGCTEEGGAYADKALGVWRVDSIPAT